MRCQAFALRLPPAPPAAPPAARSRPAHALPGCTRRPPLRSVAARSVPPERASLYETLGVAVGASSEAVKRAYRRLALRHHPDVSSAPDAPSRFQDIRRAYEGLLMGGGAQQRPWWRARWLEQLRGLPARIRDKLASKRSRRAAAAVEPAVSDAERAALDAADAEARRARVAEQLSGLQQRAARKTRRRKPPGSTSSGDNW